MQNKRISFFKGSCLFLPLALVLSGCSVNGTPPEPSEHIPASESPVRGMVFDFQVDPEEFALSLTAAGDRIPISGSFPKREVTDFKEQGEAVSWRYPNEQIAVSIEPDGDCLTVAVTSESEDDNQFTWPAISSETYYLPFGEGKRVPADDAVWREYLDGQEFSVMEQLSMPFWISSSGEYSLLFIMEDPFRTQLDFSADPDIAFTVSHEYPRIDEERTKRFRIYLTDENPVSAAKIYRDYVTEKGDFVTLEQKADQNPDIRKLYGAPFIYLWGDRLISPEDIRWPAFIKALSTPVMNFLASFADVEENGEEFLGVLEEIKTQDYVAAYQKQVICAYISRLLLRDDFWNPSVFTGSQPDSDQRLSDSEKIQVRKHALAASLPEVFTAADQWMKASTTDLLRQLQEAGIDRAWIGLNSWEQAYAKPDLVKTAAEQGYLIASYDSYHSIHKPGEEQWITARFDDPSLYEEASVTDKNGEKVKGFQQVGRKLNPALSLPAVQKRMESVRPDKLSFNSWFIDCDATGEIYDDYTPGHVTTQQEDLSARLERMRYIRDQYNLVIGSEGGHDFAASDIAFAHGIELKSFSWMDEDMKSNKDSEFYIGRYYAPDGGVAEHFSKRIPVKDKYYAVFADPKYDIPLFKLVYHDSVITGYHWDWSTFKIQGAVKDRMLREILYNVPPLYHLDAREWERYKTDIVNHHSVWSDFSRNVITREMTGFEYLSEDGSVQKTVYGDTAMAAANFGDSDVWYGDHLIPAHSVLIQTDGNSVIYTPSVQKGNE